MTVFIKLAQYPSKLIKRQYWPTGVNYAQEHVSAISRLNIANDIADGEKFYQDYQHMGMSIYSKPFLVVVGCI